MENILMQFSGFIISGSLVATLMNRYTIRSEVTYTLLHATNVRIRHSIISMATEHSIVYDFLIYLYFPLQKRCEAQNVCVSVYTDMIQGKTVGTEWNRNFVVEGLDRYIEWMVNTETSPSSWKEFCQVSFQRCLVLYVQLNNYLTCPPASLLGSIATCRFE